MSFLDILDLQPSGTDTWVGPTPAEGPPRLFGGQVASQSLRAATFTVEPPRRPHSLHAYFIRPGKPGVPLDLYVERTRDGRSFTTRRVTASQTGEPIFVLDASFHTDEDGDDWSPPDPLAGVPGPDQVPSHQFPSGFRVGSPLEIRPLGTNEMFPRHPFWVRVKEEMPDDVALHACALTFISDMAVVGSARAPGSRAGFGAASLDHAVWFHRPARADQWLLFSVEPVTNFGARGLARGSFHTEDGTLVASIAQEALLRPAPPGQQFPGAR